MLVVILTELVLSRAGGPPPDWVVARKLGGEEGGRGSGR